MENGSLRGGIEICRQYLNSVIRQEIYIYDEIDRIDMHFSIDWKESQLLLKLLFPIELNTSEAFYDIQYGSVNRSTHKNTSWDFARFEVCSHKWFAVAEEDYGFAVLNDSKYGSSIADGVIGLSLLKSAVYPNPQADKEHHEFSYALCPYSGSLRQADIAGKAYAFNNPVEAVTKKNQAGSLPPFSSFVLFI